MWPRRRVAGDVTVPNKWDWGYKNLVVSGELQGSESRGLHIISVLEECSGTTILAYSHAVSMLKTS